MSCVAHSTLNKLATAKTEYLTNRKIGHHAHTHTHMSYGHSVCGRLHSPCESVCVITAGGWGGVLYVHGGGGDVGALWDLVPGSRAIWDLVPGSRAVWDPVPGSRAVWDPVPGSRAVWDLVPGSRAVWDLVPGSWVTKLICSSESNLEYGRLGFIFALYSL